MRTFEEAEKHPINGGAKHVKDGVSGINKQAEHVKTGHLVDDCS